MVKVGALMGVFALAGSALSAHAGPVDLEKWVSGLPQHFNVSGSKTEPTYVEVVTISREGDQFSILGGAPAWAELSQETVVVDGNGDMHHSVCPKGMDCSKASRPAGFLSTAALISSSRQGRLTGTVQAETYGDYSVICVPAEQVGIEKPILDPCFELKTGAAIAQKNRFSHRFDGPSLDLATLKISTTSKKTAPEEPR